MIRARKIYLGTIFICFQFIAWQKITHIPYLSFSKFSPSLQNRLSATFAIALELQSFYFQVFRGERAVAQTRNELAHFMCFHFDCAYLRMHQSIDGLNREAFPNPTARGTSKLYCIGSNFVIPLSDDQLIPRLLFLCCFSRINYFLLLFI